MEEVVKQKSLRVLGTPQNHEKSVLLTLNTFALTNATTLRLAPLNLYSKTVHKSCKIRVNLNKVFEIKFTALLRSFKQKIHVLFRGRNSLISI